MRREGRKLLLEAIRASSRGLRDSQKERSEAGAAIGDREARTIARTVCSAMAGRTFERAITDEVSDYLEKEHSDTLKLLEREMTDALRGKQGADVDKFLGRYGDRLAREAERVLTDLEQALDDWSKDWREALLEVAEATERA